MKRVCQRVVAFHLMFSRTIRLETFNESLKNVAESIIKRPMVPKSVFRGIFSCSSVFTLIRRAKSSSETQLKRRKKLQQKTENFV